MGKEGTTFIDLATKEGFEEFLKGHIAFCRLLLTEEKEVDPFAILLVRKDEQGDLLPKIDGMLVRFQGFEDEAAYQRLPNKLRKLTKERDAVGIVFTSEGWAVPDDGRKVSPSKRLDREEVLLVHAEHRLIESPFVYKIKIHHNKSHRWLDDHVERQGLGPDCLFWDLLGRKKGN